MAEQIAMISTNNGAVLSAQLVKLQISVAGVGLQPLGGAITGGSELTHARRMRQSGPTSQPDGTAIPGRTHEQGAARPVLIEAAYFE
jgi:hypothetical protein